MSDPKNRGKLESEPIFDEKVLSDVMFEMTGGRPGTDTPLVINNKEVPVAKSTHAVYCNDDDGLDPIIKYARDYALGLED